MYLLTIWCLTNMIAIDRQDAHEKKVNKQFERGYLGGSTRPPEQAFVKVLSDDRLKRISTCLMTQQVYKPSCRFS